MPTAHSMQIKMKGTAIFMKYSKYLYRYIMLLLISIVSVGCQQKENRQDVEQKSPINLIQESDDMTIQEPTKEIVLKENVKQEKSTQIVDPLVDNPIVDNPIADNPIEDNPLVVDTQVANPTHIINPDDIFIEVYKKERILKLWNDELLIGEYQIGLGFNPVGPKEKEGDGKTPEGSYYVCVKNPNSRFYLSLGVSYPGSSDAENALASDLITQAQYDTIISAINAGTTPPWYTPLGGEIMIHGHGSGSDWTAGCVAVDNDVMDVLWELCDVGTKIMIYP